MGFGVFLDGVADVAELGAGSDHVDADQQAFITDFRQSLGLHRRLADVEHFAGVAVVTVLDDSDVDIDVVPVFEFFVVGNAVADHMIQRGADGFGETVVIQGGGNGLLFIDDIVMAEAIQLIGGDARLNMGRDHFQHLGGETPGNAHFFDFFGGFNNNAHIFCDFVARRSRRRRLLRLPVSGPRYSYPVSMRGGTLISSDFG